MNDHRILLVFGVVLSIDNTTPGDHEHHFANNTAVPAYREPIPLGPIPEHEEETSK